MELEQKQTVRSLTNWAMVRNMLLSALFVAIVLVASNIAFFMGTTMSMVLVLVIITVGLCAVIFRRPVIGLYASVLLTIALDKSVPGDSISRFTDDFHEDLNTFAHAGIAFSPLELLLIVTTLAYIVRALTTGRRLRAGTLAPHVLVFGLFLVGGYIWGILTGGDPKTGLFELRAPFMLVMLYFLVTNLANEPGQIAQLLKLMTFGFGVLAVWGLLRYLIVFHGHSDGPDGAFGGTHEDAVFLAFLGVIAVARLIFVRPQWRKALPLLLLTLPALFVMFEMQRRAAFLSLYLAVVVMAIALFYRSRKLFLAIIPPLTVLILVYSAIFWNSNSILAQPIRAWRSQTTDASLGARDYSSNEYRINEKADVRATILSAPLTGIGFGHQFFNVDPLPVLSWWPYQFYTPHAEVLWIWLKVGAGGFIAFWVVICTSLLRVGQIFRQEKMTERSFAGLLAAIFIAMLLGFAYVDVGLANERCEVLLGTMLGIIGVITRPQVKPPAAHRGWGQNPVTARVTHARSASGAIRREGADVAPVRRVAPRPARPAGDGNRVLRAPVH
jgi:hypothetical protein